MNALHIRPELSKGSKCHAWQINFSLPRLADQFLILSLTPPNCCTQAAPHCCMDAANSKCTALLTTFGTQEDCRSHRQRRSSCHGDHGSFFRSFRVAVHATADCQVDAQGHQSRCVLHNLRLQEVIPNQGLHNVVCTSHVYPGVQALQS
jgi:hypothetical protein